MTDKKFARTCCNCGIAINAGYVIEGANEHYCSDPCLHKNVTPEDFLEFYIGYKDDDDDDDIGDIQIYWTDWDDDDVYFDALYDDDDDALAA